MNNLFIILARTQFHLTSEFNEVFSPPKSEPRKMRQPAFFRVARILRDEKKFGEIGKNAWHFSVRDPISR
jgi:hypothetical protein